MTPLPKKRHSKARTKRRKSTKKIGLPTLVNCFKCQNLRMPHRACPSCGSYKQETKTGSISEKKN